MRIYLIIFVLAHVSHACATSMAYKLFISSPTQEFNAHHDHAHKKHSITSYFFNEYLKRIDGFRVNYMGTLESYVYNFGELYYLRVNAGLANLQEWIPAQKKLLEETRIEDITLTFGKSVAQTEKTILTPSLFLGIPLHNIPTRLDPKVGFCQASIGFQLDGALQINDITNIVAAGRLIYLFPRNFVDKYGNTFNFTLGNITDALLGIRNRWIYHEFGIGYKFSSINKGAVFPHLPPLTEESTFAGLLPLLSPTFIPRFNVSISSFYAAYKYKFFIHTIPNKLLFKLVYGFANNPLNNFKLKNLVTTWISWNIKF